MPTTSSGLDDLRIFGYRLDRAIRLYCEEPVERQLRRLSVMRSSHPTPTPTISQSPSWPSNASRPSRSSSLGQPIRPIRLLHGKLPLLGFRINDVAYCTDVSLIPAESWPLLEGLDTLVIDALRDQPHPTHFSVGQALEVIERVKPRRAYFTHISHSLEYDATNARLPENVELSYDGQRIPF